MVVEEWGNTSAAAIPVGACVRRITDGTWRATGIEAVADDTATDVLGVVIGGPDQSGEIDGATAIATMVSSGGSQHTRALVAVSGVCAVLLAANVAPGQWAAPSTTAGQVTAQNTPSSTTFGKFVTGGPAGGMATLRVSGGSARPTPGGIATLTLEAGDFVNTVATGLGTYKAAEFTGLLVAATLMVAPAATVEIDILKANETIVLATGTNSICGSDYPSVSSGTYAYKDTLGAWDTSVAIHDVFRLEVRSVTGSPTRVTLELAIRQS